MRDARFKPKAATAGLSARRLLDRWIVRGRMTQAEAADQIGVSRVKLNQYLSGERTPSLATAIRIEDATGIPARSWLIEDEPATVGAVPAMHGHAENS
jgi:transcriptional regulator with XRE-family HTH domain